MAFNLRGLVDWAWTQRKEKAEELWKQAQAKITLPKIEPIKTYAKARMPWTPEYQKELERFQARPQVEKIGQLIGQTAQRYPTASRFLEGYLQPSKAIYQLTGAPTPQRFLTPPPTTTREKVIETAGTMAGELPFWLAGGKLIEAPLAARIAGKGLIPRATRFATSVAASTPLISPLIRPGEPRERFAPKRLATETATDVAFAALLFGGLKPVRKLLPEVKIPDYMKVSPDQVRRDASQGVQAAIDAAQKRRIKGWKIEVPRGIIAKLESEIDQLIGYKPEGLHWKQEFQMRGRLLDYAKSEAPTTVVKKIDALQSRLADIRIARETAEKAGKAIPEIKPHVVEKIRASLKDLKLDKQYFKPIRGELGEVIGIRARPTPRTIGKIAAREEKAARKTTESLFNEWQRAIRAETVTPKQAINLGLRQMREATDQAVKVRLAEKAGKVTVLDYFATPEYVFRKLGISDAFKGLREGSEKTARDLNTNFTQLNEWHKTLKDVPDASQRVFRYLDGRLGAEGLTPTEYRIAEEMKVFLRDWADKLGLPRDRRIVDYITHIFESDLKTTKGLPDELVQILDYVTPSGVFNPYMRQRTGAVGYSEDTFLALEAYVRRGVRQINLDKPINQAAQYAKSLPASGFKYVDSFLKKLQSRPGRVEALIDDTIKALPFVGERAGRRPTAQSLGALRRWVYRSTLGLNVSAALKNITQNVNTFAELGAENTSVGFYKLATEGTGELVENQVLDSIIRADYRVKPFTNLIDRVDPVLYFLFDTAEKINRGVAYYAAKNNALRRQLSEEAAIEFAKETVRKTQFGYSNLDMPLILQDPIMKTLFQYSSYPIRQTELMVGWIKNKEFSKLAKYIGSTLVIVWGMGDLLGMDIEDFTTRNISGLGLGPIPSTLQAAISAKIDPDDYKARQELERNIPAILIPAGIQMRKTLKGATGESRTPTGQLRFEYPVGIRSLALGEWRTPQAATYIERLEKGKKESAGKKRIKTTFVNALVAGKDVTAIANQAKEFGFERNDIKAIVKDAIIQAIKEKKPREQIEKLQDLGYRLGVTDPIVRKALEKGETPLQLNDIADDIIAANKAGDKDKIRKLIEEAENLGIARDVLFDTIRERR